MDEGPKAISDAKTRWHSYKSKVRWPTKHDLKTVGVFIPFIGVATLASLWSYSVSSPLTISLTEARNYSGILSGVIPILLLGVYVDTTARWTERLSTRRELEEDIEKSAMEVEERHTKVVQLKEQVDQGNTLDVFDEDIAKLDSIFEESKATILKYSSMKGRLEKVAKNDGREVFLMAVQLFSAIIGELFAITSILLPTNRGVHFATVATVLLLLLFAARLFQWPLDLDAGKGIRTLSIIAMGIVGMSSAVMFPQVLRITIAG